MESFKKACCKFKFGIYPCLNYCSVTVKIALICLSALLMLACGGGGGGGGFVAFQDKPGVHNGGDSGGFGSGNQTGGGFGDNGFSSSSSSDGLLFETVPSFFYPIDHIDVSLDISGSPAEFPGLTTSATKDVLGLSNGDEVSGTLLITLSDGSTRNATLSPTTIGIDTKLSFAVTYNYILVDGAGNEAEQTGTYTSFGGIDVSGITWTSTPGGGTNISNWKSDSGATYPADGTITGITGDVRLTSMYGSSGITEYKYSLVYQRGNGAGGYINVPITGCQDVVFTPGSTLRFGVAEIVSTLTMGDLDSSLTGIEAAMPITGWKSSRDPSPTTYSSPFPPVSATDCESDGTITLIATTDIGALYNNCRATENAVMDGDVVLSNGLCVNKLYYNNHSTDLNPYVVGTVCIIDGGGQKFVIAKDPGINNKKWTETNHDLPSMQVTDWTTVTAQGTNSLATLQAALTAIGETFNLDDYPAFAECANYGNTLTNIPSGGSYESGWYLPSIYEASVIYNKKSNFPTGFVSDAAWIQTSTANTQTYYFIYDFQHTQVRTQLKTNPDSNIDVYPCHEFNFTAPPSP